MCRHCHATDRDPGCDATAVARHRTDNPTPRADDPTQRAADTDHPPTDRDSAGRSRATGRSADAGGVSAGRSRVTGPGAGITRRAVLGGAATLGAVALAGCSFGGEEVPEPVDLSAGQDCDVCGMVIQNHPGPNGQIFYRNDAPEGHDNPARFDSLKQCLFPYLFEHRRTGWTARVVYVTDYSAVDYDLQSEGGTAYISSHTEPASFADAEGLFYVVGSDVEGAMGPDFVPFSDRDDADALAADRGGEVVRFGEIDEALVGR